MLLVVSEDRFSSLQIVFEVSLPLLDRISKDAAMFEVFEHLFWMMSPAKRVASRRKGHETVIGLDVKMFHINWLPKKTVNLQTD